MLKKNWGRIIFISSESAQHIPPEMIHYGMTKTAQVAVARGLAESVAGTGVTVNSILAVPLLPKASVTLSRAWPNNKASRKPKSKNSFFNCPPFSLLKRFETPEEVAAVVAFVASAQATSINGSAVRAEGGVIRSIF